MSSKRVSLSKKQRDTVAGKELISLCLDIAADGVLTGDEVSRLAYWLRDNKDSELPAVGFLIEPIKRIIAAGKASRNDRQELFLAVEAVLPRDLREEITAKRKELAARRRAEEKQARADAKERQRQERERALQEFLAQHVNSRDSSGIYHFHDRIAGVSYPNEDGSSRQQILRNTSAGSRIILRHVRNAYDPHAIAVRHERYGQMGFLPAETAGEVFYEMQEGTRFHGFVVSVGSPSGVRTLGCRILVIAIPKASTDAQIEQYRSMHNLPYTLAQLKEIPRESKSIFQLLRSMFQR